MANVIHMQDMRYLNLFGKITKVQTRFYLDYNGALVFCVPKSLVSKAVGRGGENVRRMSGILRKRIKVVSQPKGSENIKDFIESIVSPVTFKDVEVKDNEVVLDAGGTQNKASLIGRNKRRFLEMQKIIRNYFGKEFRII